MFIYSHMAQCRSVTLYLSCFMLTLRYPQVVLVFRLLDMVRELIPSGWTMWAVLELNCCLVIVPPRALASTTVATMKMLV